MKKRIILALMSLGVASVLSLSVVSSSASAQVSSGINAATTDEMRNKQIDGSGGVIRTVSNILIWVVGIVAVIMIVWSGFKYMTAAGDSGKIASAKSSLIYAIVGLIIAILAYAIVNFVMERLNVSSASKSSGSSSSIGAGVGGGVGGAMGSSGGSYAEERRRIEEEKKKEAERKRAEEEERRKMEKRKEEEKRERERRGASIFGG